jgi:DNA-binding NarL/FixJ family response regulator
MTLIVLITIWLLAWGFLLYVLAGGGHTVNCRSCGLDVSKFVSRGGCKVVGLASDGQAAVESAAMLRPDVLVLDISMPRLNGIEAAKVMKERNPSTRIVFLTVEKDPDTCRTALDTGAAAMCSRLGKLQI